MYARWCTRAVGLGSVLAFQNYKLDIANTTCHWNTGVMVADNGPLYAYVDIL